LAVMLFTPFFEVLVFIMCISSHKEPYSAMHTFAYHLCIYAWLKQGGSAGLLESRYMMQERLEN
jgi:hypothetical protein